MDRVTEQAYKRRCFQGRGLVARSLDMAFFSLLGGACLYVLKRNLGFSILLSGMLLLVFVLWERKRWDRYKQCILQEATKALRREAWLQQEGESIRGKGGVILYPTPDRKDMIGFCLRLGQGTAYHCFGDTNEELLAVAEAFECSIAFHPWQEGPEPSRAQVIERLRREVRIFGQGLYSPDQGVLPRYTSGIYVKDCTKLYVSRGAGTHSFLPPRIFNRPEIDLITLKTPSR